MKIIYFVNLFLRSNNEIYFKNRFAPLVFPEGYNEKKLYDFVTSIRVSDAPEKEMQAYGSHDFKRFVYTWGLTRNLSGRLLELGANPYFTTMLLKKFGNFDLELANYFGDLPNGLAKQNVTYKNTELGNLENIEFKYMHFNIENDLFPYKDNSFDVIIFAEIIEHLLNDPCKVLREIKRVLKPSGVLILTTPNVSRIENVSKMIAGQNIYDPYSGYGPYGRHNREYNRHELVSLLNFVGFEVNEHFTSDVHINNANAFFDISKLKDMLSFRESDLGQYIFIRAKNTINNSEKKPNWLYRSYPDDQLI
jgi:SAM-dependent methyltransferase